MLADSSWNRAGSPSRWALALVVRGARRSVTYRRGAVDPFRRRGGTRREAAGTLPGRVGDLTNLSATIQHPRRNAPPCLQAQDADTDDG